MDLSQNQPNLYLTKMPASIATYDEVNKYSDLP